MTEPDPADLEGQSPEQVLAAKEIETLYQGLLGALQRHAVTINVALGAVERLKIELTAKVLAGAGFIFFREKPDTDDQPQTPEGM